MSGLTNYKESGSQSVFPVTASKPHAEVAAMLGRIRELVAELNAKSRAKVESLTDDIEVLTEPYMSADSEYDWGRYKLTPTEIIIAEALRVKVGRVFTKEAIYDALYWNRVHADDAPDMKVIDVLICKLRKKLLAGNCEYGILTGWGIGYSLAPAEECKVVKLGKPQSPKSSWQGMPMSKRQAAVAAQLEARLGQFLEEPDNASDLRTQRSAANTLRGKLKGKYRIISRKGLGHMMLKVA